jgi:FKBP12-rapamycin complex-associated protein
LQEAFDWCKKYQKFKRENDLTQAWDLYYNVFRKISKQLQSMKTMDLQAVSPKLLDSQNLILAVPGTYKAGSENIIRIAKFDKQLKVISSKQRPRKLKLSGLDGNDYPFLLKG